MKNFGVLSVLTVGFVLSACGGVARQTELAGKGSGGSNQVGENLRAESQRQGDDQSESRSDQSRLARGTQAWFVQESGEHEVRALIAAGTITEASVSALTIAITAPAFSQVTVTSTAGDILDTCEMQDHWSRRGTVLKKEVYCGNSPNDAASSDLTRGSNAWALVEGIEHAVRAEALANAAIAGELTGGASVITGNNVAVILSLADGSELGYLCSLINSSSRSNAVTRADLRCIKE